MTGEVKPVKGSSTVRVGSKPIIRDKDPNTMNGGNNPGIYTTTQIPSGNSPKHAATNSNPPVRAETAAEKSLIDKALDATKSGAQYYKNTVSDSLHGFAADAMDKGGTIALTGGGTAAVGDAMVLTGIGAAPGAVIAAGGGAVAVVGEGVGLVGGIVESTASYTYSDTGDLLSHTDANGAQRRYEWRNHVLVAYTEPDGARYCADYDAYSPSGRVTRSYAAIDGRGLHFVYNDHACATRVTDELGRSTLYEYDARKDIIATTGPDGIRVATPFDSNGHPRGSIDPLGRQSFFQFDRRGNLTTLVDAAGARTSIDYNPLDLPVKLTDALQHIWRRDYDPRGNLAKVTDPLEQSICYSYDSHGQPVTITDARGGNKQLQWDAAGNLIAYTDCSGHTTRFTYDMLGRLLSRVDALGHTTYYCWDAVGRLSSMTEPSSNNDKNNNEDNNQTKHYYQWSAEGRLLSYTDPLGATTTYHYNRHGEPIQRSDANGNTLDYAYDAVGRLIRLTNENGDSTYFSYDIADQLTDETGFDGRHQRYCYNAAGELTHLIEAGGSQFGPGKVTRFERDAIGRLVAKHAEDDTSCQAQFTYDTLGRLTNANNPAAQLAFAYDPLGQLLTESQTLVNGSTKILKHGYDELGNRIQSTLPDQRSLHWLFYGSGHLHQINLAQPHQHTQHQVIADMERDALHREVKRSQGSLESRYDYDPMGRLTRHKAGQAKANPIVTSMSYSTTRDASVEIERSYRYDAAGNLTNQIDALRGKQNYQYDPTGRILAATGRLNEAFAFDPAGNIQTTQSGRAAAKVKGNRLSVYQDLRFEYDLHGNVINRKKGAHEEAQFTWNGDHQLQNATVTRHGVTQTTSYEYDALGRRTKKTDAFGATEYLWDGDLMIHSQRGNKASLFVFEPNSFVPLATIQDDNIYWYQCDQIGAPQELTDEEGKIIWAADYKVWGEARLRDVSLKTGTDNWSSSSNYNWQTSTKPTPVIDQPFRFQGQQFDEETGLHYNRFRYYDPAVGRFVSEDPIGLMGGNNLFSYGQNSIEWIDPLGLAGRRVLTGNDKSGRPLSSDKYSVWTQTTIPCNLLSGTRGDHFKDANQQLHQMILESPEFGNSLGKDVVAHVKPGARGAYSDKSPPGLSWHHNNDDPTKMELVPRAQHQAPGEVQKSLHPDQGGGFKKLNCS